MVILFINLLAFTDSHLAPLFVYAFCMTRRNNSEYLCKQSDQLDFLMGTKPTFLAVANIVLYINYMEFELKLLD